MTDLDVNVEVQRNEPIRGSVAQILNSRELVINRGSGHGVQIGMRFAILNRHGADIVDPDSGESLGSIDIEKTIMKIVRVQERLSVARTFRTFSKAGSGIANIASWYGNPPSTEFETIDTKEGTYQEELEEEDSFIKKGDPVVEVRGEEFIDN